MIILGDSAGDGLSLSVAQFAEQQRGLNSPAAVVLISPAGNWSLRAALFYKNENRAPFFRMATFLLFRRLYIYGYSIDDPTVSLQYGDFSGFPPKLFLPVTPN